MLAVGLMTLAFLSGSALAQDVAVAELHALPDSASAESIPVNPGMAIIAPNPRTLPEAPSQHRFWDNENRALFASVGALSAADFAVTRSILQDGGKELNPVTRVFSGSTAGLAVNFAGETAGIIGISYIFHRTGHHQLERIAPLLNIGASAFAVVYDLSHR
jgi:hypothetical protein